MKMILGKSRNFKKCLAGVLSLLFTISTCEPETSASAIDSIKKTAISVANSAKDKAKNFYKNHPYISQTILYFGTYYTIDVLISHAVREWDLRDVTTEIDGLSNTEVKKELKLEVQKYKDRAPDIFTIDGDVVKKSNPRMLLLTMKRLNYLFDKYENFTKELIKYKKSDKTDIKEFRIRFMNLFDDGKLSYKAELVTGLDLSCIMFNKTTFCRNYRTNLYKYKGTVEKKHWSPHDMDKLIEYVITHEFGHLLESLYITKKSDIEWKKVTPSSKRYYKSESQIEQEELMLAKVNPMAVKIKREILQKLGKYDSRTISIYGQSDPLEFFAEAFAHMECSSEENINPIGIATRNYIKNWFK